MNDQQNSAINGLEIELKFELSPSEVQKLCRAPQFKAMQKARARGMTLRATYFDTPEHDLAKRKLALRVRQEGRRYVQCLKAQSDNVDGAGFARREWEWPVGEMALDVAVLKADAEIKTLLKGVKFGQIQPIYATDIKRQSRDLHMPGGALVQCDIDQGRVYLGAEESLLCELELELKSGSVADLFRTASQIVDIVPARLSNRTKAGRGANLARGAYGWVHAHHPPLSQGVCAEDVLRTSVMEALQHLLSNEDCVLQRCDIEGVHQMRIALRRMRSVITAFKKALPKGTFEDLSAGLKVAGNTLGPARDWDVFLHEILSPVAAGFEQDDDVSFMMARAVLRQNQAYADVQEMIRSPHYARLLMDAAVWGGVGAWREGGPSGKLKRSAQYVAKHVLQSRHARLLEAGDGVEALSIHERHALRIAVKKARYAAAFFAELYDRKRTKPYLKSLKGLQESLGHLNDLATAGRLMEDLISKERGAAVSKLNRASGKVEGWYMHAHVLHEKSLKNAWHKFKKSKPFW